MSLIGKLLMIFERCCFLQDELRQFHSHSAQVLLTILTLSFSLQDETNALFVHVLDSLGRLVHLNLELLSIIVKRVLFQILKFIVSLSHLR